MDNLIEELLHEDEGPSLDFKRDQYVFDGASDNDRSELLKDILAFANARRRTEAYILIGVQEIRGARSRPVGVPKHLNEANLQQFVNAKVNRPLEFRYDVVPVDGVEIGIVCIPVQRERPFYLKKDYGKLKKDTVHIRRGSSTDIAKPDEIAKMGIGLNFIQPPRLSLLARHVLGRGLKVIVAIQNPSGSGPARAPRLSLQVLGPFSLCHYGLDGNNNDGLPRLPQGSDSAYVTFAGDAGMIIHPGITHDVACLECRGQPERWPDQIEIPYQLSADGFDATEGTLQLSF
jgi:hypothetical protein